MFELNTLKSKKLSDLQEIAKSIGLKGVSAQKKQDLIYQIIDHQSANPPENSDKNIVNNNKPIDDSISVNRENVKEKRVPKHQNNKPSITSEKQKPTIFKENSNNINKSKNIPKVEGSQKNENLKPKPNFQNKNNNQKREPNHNRDNRNRYREPDFEFEGIIQTEGVLETMQEGYGFLRSSDYHYLSSPDDVYISQSQVRLFGLKTGDTVIGAVRPPKEGEKYFPLIKVDTINGLDPKVVRDRVSFEHLTPLFPQEKFKLADKENTVSTRIMDLFSNRKRTKRNDCFPAKNWKNYAFKRYCKCNCCQSS